MEMCVEFNISLPKKLFKWLLYDAGGFEWFKECNFNMSILLCEVDLVMFLMILSLRTPSEKYTKETCGFNDSILPNIIQLNVAWFMYRG